MKCFQFVREDQLVLFSALPLNSIGDVEKEDIFQGQPRNRSFMKVMAERTLGEP